MPAYYNEHDRLAAQWLRELIKLGQIAPGDVDERDIRDVTPEDLYPYTQHHFFAGIGGWSYALRLAGWPDDRPVVTGSPPCQPFSLAGKKLGVKDERHLAPKFLSLVAALRPPALFGEQVATAVNKDNWLDDVLDALENLGYDTGAAVVPACSVDAPHIRQRLYFVGRLADSQGDHDRGQRWSAAEACEGRSRGLGASSSSQAGGMADTVFNGLQGRLQRRQDAQRETVDRPAGRDSTDCGVWDEPDWLFCRDGKHRPVEPGLSPLADGLSARVGRSSGVSFQSQEARVMRLKGYGNAIVPQLAAEIIKAAITSSAREI